MTTHWRITLSSVQEGDSRRGLVTLKGSTSSSALPDVIGDAADRAHAWADKFGRTLAGCATLQLDGEDEDDDYYKIEGLDGSLSFDEIAERAVRERVHRRSQKEQSPPQSERSVRTPVGVASCYGAESAGFGTAWQALRDLVADVSIVSGAPLEDVTKVESATGVRWTADLRTLFTQHSGGFELVPAFELVDLGRVLEVRQMFFDAEESVVEQNADLPPVAADAERPAGSPADRFVPQFIPIAEDNTGAVLIVDMRSGELSGCVIEFSTSMGGSEALWPSLGALVSDVITALTTNGALFQGKYRPEVGAGLTWSRMT